MADNNFENYQYNISVSPETEKRALMRSAAFKKRRRKRKIIRNTVIFLLCVGIISSILAVLLKKPKEINPLPETNQSTVNTEVENVKKYGYFKADGSVKYFGSFIDSDNAILIDLDDGKIVAQKAADDIIAPASMTKILTLLLAVENLPDLTQSFTMTAKIVGEKYSKGASLSGFAPGEVLTVEDLLYGAILPSGADATCALATMVSGSESAFADLMNQKAREFGLATAVFSNSSGLDDTPNRCTVHDVAVILSAAVDNEICLNVLSTYQRTTSCTAKHPEGLLLTSTLFSRMYGTEPGNATIVAGKTGYTTEAGNCLATYGISKSGKHYILVTANAHGRWKAIHDHINVYANSEFLP